MGAGGYARDDEAIAFFTRIRALVRPDMVVVDLGAGRGSRFDEPDGFHARFCNLQGEVARLVGLDVDDAVRAHPHLDEAHVLSAGAPFPLADRSVDLLFCEYVLEHVEEPNAFAAEIGRVLKPGGWFCALTPNRRGYVGLGNRLVPPAAKRALMHRLWPERRDQDAFETHYRLNTLADLRRAFPGWHHHSHVQAATPKYHANATPLFLAVAMLQRLAPDALQTNLMVFVRKNEAGRVLVEPPEMIADLEQAEERLAAFAGMPSEGSARPVPATALASPRPRTPPRPRFS